MSLTREQIAALVDPQVLAGLGATLPDHLPAGPLTPQLVREIDSRLVVWCDESARVVTIPRPDGSALELRLHDGVSTGAVILWIHGGGMFLGSARQDDALCQELSQNLGVSVVSVDYRLAPEHRHPEPLDDCALALDWLCGRFDTVVVVGASAGGGLAAGLALRARDSSGPPIAGLHLYYPMLDDRTTASKVELAETLIWNSRLDEVAWSAYLGEPDAYGAPARASDLSGLPPTWISAGEFDLFLDEDVRFAERLRTAGVPVTLTIGERTLHCSEFVVPDLPASRAAKSRHLDALRSQLVAVTA